jgi:ADP-ribose pyrophosphatase YjhB (NUDIX family)
MSPSREYPEKPVVGIGGVIIDQGRALLIRRGSEPLRGEWSIPGGTLEIGETLEEAWLANCSKKRESKFASSR